MANLEHRGYLPLKASPDFNSSFPLSGEESYLLTFAISHRGSKIIGFVLTFVHLSEARGGRGGSVGGRSSDWLRTWRTASRRVTESPPNDGMTSRQVARCVTPGERGNGRVHKRINIISCRKQRERREIFIKSHILLFTYWVFNILISEYNIIYFLLIYLYTVSI